MIIFKLKINDSGFTILEALVTTAIIAIMSVVYLTNYRPTNQRIVLDQAAASLVSDLRYVQNMAMNVKKFGTGPAGEIPQGGYGVNFMASFGTYTLYADTNGDKQFDASDGIVAVRTFDSPILVSSVTDNRSNINFLPPNPNVYFDGMLASTLFNSSITITIQYGTTGPTKNIVINGLTGQISVN